jgi:RNA polymerase sigma-70 factor (ECF subfamily)
MTQEEFVRQIQANEGIIQKICRLYGHTRPDREDLFQEIIVQLWKSPDVSGQPVPKFKGQSKFITWVYHPDLKKKLVILYYD